MPGDNTPADINRALRGPMQVNQALNVSTREGFWNFQPDQPISDRQDFDPYNVWIETNGGAVSRDAQSLYAVETDGAQADSEAILETADLGIYKPGVLVNASGGVWINEIPTGDAFYEVGYEQTGAPERLDFKIDSSGDLKFEWDSAGYTDGPFTIGPDEMLDNSVTEFEDGGETIARVYGQREKSGLGFDPRDWDPAAGYTYGITIGWYGPTAAMPWIGSVGNVNGEWVQRAYPLAVIRPIGQPLIQQPNRPWSVRANNGSSGQDLKAQVGGRQFSITGAVETSPEPTFAFATNQDIPTTGAGEGDWSVIGVIKRKAGYEGTAVGVSSISVAPDSNDIVVQARVVDPSFLTGVSYDEPKDLHAEQTAIEVDLDSTTPDDVTIDTATIDGTTKLEGVAWTGGFTNATNQSTGDTQISSGFDFPLVRENPTVLLAATRTGKAATVDTGVEIIESG